MVRHSHSRARVGRTTEILIRIELASGLSVQQIQGIGRVVHKHHPLTRCI